MGLHQQNSISLGQTIEEAVEYNHTFWVLYIMDKAISLTMGQSRCLPMYDCDVGSLNHDPSSPFCEYFIARVERAAMQEDVYQTLYSSQARRGGDYGKSDSISESDDKPRDDMETCVRMLLMTLSPPRLQIPCILMQVRL